jgi:hypothetical protein
VPTISRFPGSDPAYRAVLSRQISTRVEDGIDVIEWTCPRCAGPSQAIEMVPDPVVALESTKDPEEPRRVRVECECDCGGEHDGRPSDGCGCGYGAKLRFFL